jgi:hypothetical protein
MKNGNKPINPILDWNEVKADSIGLTKREHFAIIALQGLCAYNGTMNTHNVDSTIKRSIELADELLKQLES